MCCWMGVFVSEVCYSEMRKNNTFGLSFDGRNGVAIYPFQRVRQKQQGDGGTVKNEGSRQSEGLLYICFVVRGFVQ